MGFCESGEANRRQFFEYLHWSLNLEFQGFLIKWPGSVGWPASWSITSGDLAEKTTYWRDCCSNARVWTFLQNMVRKVTVLRWHTLGSTKTALEYGSCLCVPETFWINTLSWVLETRLGIFPYFPCLSPAPPPKPWLCEKCPSPVLCCGAGRDKYQPWCLHPLQGAVRGTALPLLCLLGRLQGSAWVSGGVIASRRCLEGL